MRARRRAPRERAADRPRPRRGARGPGAHRSLARSRPSAHSACAQPAAAAAPRRLGGRDGPQPEGRTTGSPRSRPTPQPVRLCPRDPVRRPKPVPGNCPSPWMALKISKDGGETWGGQRPLCACKGSGQFDPIIEVVPDTGAVYAAYMNGYNVMFSESTDHGAHVDRAGQDLRQRRWNDKPVLAVSDDGQDVYIAGTDRRAAIPGSRSRTTPARTWTQTRSSSADRYFYAFDGDVAARRPRRLRARARWTTRTTSTSQGPGRRSTCSCPTTGDAAGRTCSSTPVRPSDRVRRLPRRLLRGHTRRVRRREREPRARLRRRRPRIDGLAADLRAALDRRRHDVERTRRPCPPTASMRPRR